MSESIARAMAIDAETGTTHWQDAISQELKALKFRLVFHVKPDTLQRRKARLVLHEDNKMDVDTPIATNAIQTDSEVSLLVAEAHIPTKSKAGPKQKSKQQGKKQESKPKPSKGKSNKGKFPKKANKFSMLYLQPMSLALLSGRACRRKSSKQPGLDAVS
jgi:hypothetical protein